MAYSYSALDTKNRDWFSNDNTRGSLTKIELTAGRMRGLTPFSLDIRYPILAIAGSNGVGKTTLLALAACAFHAPRDGFRLPARKAAHYTFSDFFVQAAGEAGPDGVEIYYTIRHNNWRKSPAGEGRQIRKKRAGGKWNDYDLRVKRTVVYFGVQRVVPYFERSQHRSYRARFQPGAMQAEVQQKIAAIAGRIIGKTYAGYESHEHGKYALPKVSAGGQSYSGFNMGAGESAVFEILAALFAAGPGCLLVIDELELGLHERAQARLIEELKTLCNERKCQIICTTHSHAILAALPPEGRVFVDNIGGNTLLYPEISPDYACGKMGRENAQELDIFVEDEVGEALLLKALDAELRARTRVLPIGSHSSLKRVMAARYMEGRRKCLCFLDGDQRSTHEAAKSAVANNCDGRFDAQKEAIKAWADARLAYLPGDTWPEKWVFEQAITYCTIPGLLCPSPAAGWGLPEAQLLGMLQRALAAGKHNEFYTLAKDLNLLVEQVSSDLLSALKQCNAQPFEAIKTQIQQLMA